MAGRTTVVCLAALAAAAGGGAAWAQDVCIPIGISSTVDGKVLGDASWNGATRIDLDNPGINPTTYLRLRRTDAPDAALYLGLVVNTPALLPNASDRIVIGFSPLSDTPSAAWRIHIAPFGGGLFPGAGMPSSVLYWRNAAPGWNFTAGTDPNDPNPLNDWMKPSTMRVFYYGASRWDFEWKIPLGATPASMNGDQALYLPPPGSTFRFYFNLVKTSGSGFACQYPWPLTRPLSPSLNSGTPDISYWGNGSLDQRAECGVLLTWDRIGLQIPPAATDNQVMCFAPAGDFPDCSTILPGDNWPDMQGPVNTFYAFPVNKMATGANVQATFNIAPWGSPAPGDWSLVQYPAAATPPVPALVNPPTPATAIYPLAQGTITLGWPLTFQESCMMHASPFQSIQVFLSAPASDTFTNFPYNPVERSLDTVSASAFHRAARIGTKGFPAAGPGPVQMILTVGQEVRPRGTPPPSVPSSPAGAPNPGAPAVRTARMGLSDAQLYRDPADVAAARTPAGIQESLLWTCRAFRKTGQKLKIEDGPASMEFDDTAKASAFGYLCGHAGMVERWDASFEGPGLTKLAQGVFALDIAPGSSALVETRIEAEEFRPWGAEVSFGFAVPHSRFSKQVHSGGAETFGLEYRLDPMFALEGQMSGAEFRKHSGGSDVTVVGTAVGGRAYFLEGPVRPFAEFGIGFYARSPGRDGVGLDVGAGVRWRLSDQVGLTASYRFRDIVVPGVDPVYSTFELGVSLRF